MTTPQAIPPEPPPAPIEAALKRMSWVLTLRDVAAILVAVAVGSIVSWRTLSGEARAQGQRAAADVAAAVVITDKKTDATQEDLTRYKREVDARFGRLEKQQTRIEDKAGRTETKLDALFEKWKLPNPAPAPVEDAAPSSRLRPDGGK